MNFTTITALRPWRSDPKDCCWLQLVKMTEWASATEASQVVPTENPVYPGDELLLSGQALILGVRTMKRALGAISNQNIADEIVSMARETPGWLASDPCPGRGIIGAILRGSRSAQSRSAQPRSADILSCWLRSQMEAAAAGR